LIQRSSVFWKKRDAYACAQLDLLARHSGWRHQAILQEFGNTDSGIPIHRALNDNAKLVAAGPRQGAAALDAASKTMRDILQSKIAGKMAEPVIDRLESIQIDRQHGDPDTFLLRPRERLA
jgi:hypothetical protein